MPWKEQTTMEQKVAFICEWRTGKYSLTELCQSFGISRPTAYKMIHSLKQKGMEGLLEESKRPHSHPEAN